MSVYLNSHPIISPKVIGSSVEDEVVIVLPEKGKVKVLNTVGARIWSLVNGENSVGDIARIICAEFQVDLVQAESDTLEFIAELVKNEIFLLSDQTG